ncbi:DUF6221 family protein [Streptomyces sp. NPDC058470]|uniref:DUF6221 family protein n=1 Tax=Streptomyces sp. NPDC058470 TaxID=3346515 RepID=UPI003648317B
MVYVDLADVMDFLEARLVEDETEAKELKPGKNQNVARLRDRVLADVEAKRRLMGWVQELPWSPQDRPRSIVEGAIVNAVANIPLKLRSPVVFKLVEAYVGHPEFRPEWGPIEDECKLSTRTQGHSV